MRKLQQKRILLLISSFLCAFFLYTWKKHLILISRTDSFKSLAAPRYSIVDSQEQRKANIRSVCERNNLNGSSFVVPRSVAAQLYVEHSHKFIYCEVPKVGCSNWKRIILLLNKSLDLSADELQHFQVHKSKQLIKLSSYPPSLQKQLLANYTKVMFTRDPLERVVSAYRDKFLHYDDVYYSTNISNLIKNTLGIHSKASLTFDQFACFIVQENPSYRDTHWKPMNELCDPCKIQYDIIGKFETLAEDANLVLRTIGASQNLKYPTIKHHSSESRTSEDISKHYLEMLPPVLFRKLMKIYGLDFSMFEYSFYKSEFSKIPKTTYIY
ncbi:carbohydrate sulfotransferase 9-like [Bufo bufo]|uniref:carbohydrate sulfotransferase 9-like n=1 Tax=Bufo bufo TaxID=8384 RepID=UPI001ABEDC5D|nr:carbohydrate sulfotransferase 9-like [Bufo bufo]